MDYPAATGRTGNQNLLDLLEILAVLRARAKFIVLTAVAVVLLSVLVALFLKPVYKATSAILIDPTVQQPFDTKNQSRGSSQDNSQFIDSQVTLLTSDSVLRPVVVSQNLVKDREFGTVEASGFLHSLMQMLRPGADKGAAAAELAESKSVIALAKATTAKRDGQTFVLTIAVQSRDPAKAAQLSRAVADSYLNDQKQQLEKASRQVANEIDDRLIGLRERLRLAEDKVQEFRAQNNLQVVGEAGLVTEQELSGVNSSLIEARAALAASEAKNSEIQRLLAQGANADAIVATIDSPNIQHLYEQYTEASRLEADLRADLLPSHPSLQRAQSQVAQVRQMIRDEVTRIAQSTELDLEVARGRVANLEKQLNSTRTLNNADDAARIRLRELQTEAQATRALYENALGRAKEILELEQVVVPNARIISPAVVPESPTWPNKKLIVVLAGILGLLIGSCLAVGGTAFRLLKARLLRESAMLAEPLPELAPAYEQVSRPVPVGSMSSGPYESPVRTTVQDKFSSEPVLGYLPQFPLIESVQGDSAHLSEDAHAIHHALQLFYDHKASGATATFGQAAENIHLSLDKMLKHDGLRSVLITSPDAGLEQSMTALTLALAGACRGMKVLLVDAEALNRDLTRGLDPRPFIRQLSIAKRVRNDLGLGISFVTLSAGQNRDGQFHLSEQASLELKEIIRDHDLTIINGPLMRDLYSAALLAVSDHIIVASTDGGAVSLSTLSTPHD
ncbi:MULTISPECIES: GumC family protein [Alphaproteobacteria]|uniref:Polysaccharide chain length determinant N-terminal domain-containing protein n=2 Tax=Alphaproteobacteria TaxID=28211 RepID=A0A512HII0_9HYPH|nr:MULTISPECIES: exopolysaccharide transport family protein [Alphaproteobacteria]GEO85259.1 hypothetical protein RNA01_21910 [Ciceribacter naphthalenivorans]GLR20898.1 hypothetical protein GCM10007920_06830 [Ciceribacter naphthalenivorans]GLT03754.1 hypothetical protein GCM10007926_06830 [Sphingomonas psychrolutea]